MEDGGRWLLLIHQLPPRPLYLRAQVRRRLNQVGALPLKNSVYVLPGRQGQGIGAALMQALIEACEARGYRQMIAVIGEPTNTASIRLHEKFGFTLVGVFRGIAWKHDRWLDTVQMQRTLGVGTDAPPKDE